MKKGILIFFLIAILWVIISDSIPARVPEIERQQEVSRELHTIGKELIQFSPPQRGEKYVKEFLQKRELKHITIGNLEVLSIKEQASSSDAYLIYREPEATYTFHLDGHTTVDKK